MDSDIQRRRAIRAENARRAAQRAEVARLEGNEWFKKGDYIQAAALYLQAINYHGCQPILLSNIAACYSKLGCYDEVEDVTTRALEHDPRNLKARYRRAIARKNLGIFKGAIKDLEAILTLDPNNVEASRELAILRTLEDFSSPPEYYPEDYPLLTAEPFDLGADSDTEDSRHKPGKTPCRYYNRGLCDRGASCRFSHAPDSVSVRDELGRNVCARFLMGRCTRDSTKCVYSHSREHLPPNGWWSNPESLEAAKRLAHVVEDDETAYFDLYVPLLANVKGQSYAARRQREILMIHLHIQFASVAGNLSRKTASPAPPDGEFILVLDSEYEGLAESLHQALYSAMEAKVKLIHVRDADEEVGAEIALLYMGSPYLLGVLITDAEVFQSEAYVAVVEDLVEYVNEGGTVVLGGQLPNEIHPSEFNEIMKDIWDLDWEYGSYLRTTFALNPRNELAKANPSLPETYSMKALHIANVSSKDAVYTQTASSQVESRVFPPLNVKDVSRREESPAVYTQVGKGFLGFVGDVNREAGSIKLTMAMFGILDPKSSAPVAEASPQAGSSKQAMEVQDSDHAAVKVTDKYVVLLELDPTSQFQTQFSAQVEGLNRAIEVKHTRNVNDAVALITGSNVQGVYVVDKGIAESANVDVLEALVQFVKDGGPVVFGGTFPGDLKLEEDQLSRVFSAFGLPWISGSFCKCEAQLNRHHSTAVANPNLPDAYYLTALNLSGFHAEDLFFEQYFDEYDNFHKDFTPPGGDTWEAPILRSRIGKGHVGYIGDTRSEPQSVPVLLSMLELLNPPKELVRDEEKFMLFITGFTEKEVDMFGHDFLVDAKSKVEIIFGLRDLSKPRVVDLLSSPDLVGVFVADAAVLRPQNAYFLSQLVKYSKNGGTLVFGWLFPKEVTLTQFRPLFRDNWGLDWDMVSIHLQNTSVASNSKNILVKSQKPGKLFRTFDYRGVYVKGIAESAAVYTPQKNKALWNPAEKMYASSVIFTEVEKGKLGYIGSASLDGESRSIVYAMMGLL